MRFTDPGTLAAVSFYALTVFWAALAFSPALVEISFTAALLAWLAHKAITRQFPLESMDRRPKLFLLGYVLIVILSYFWSEHPAQSFRGLFKVVQHVMVFVMVSDVFGESKRLSFFENAALAVFLLIGLNGFYQYLSGSDLIRRFPSLDSYAGARITSSFKAYGLFASYLLCWGTYAAVVLFFKSGRSRAAYAAAAAFSAAAFTLLFMTRSRGAILACAAAFFLMLILTRKFRVLAVLAMFFCAGLFFVPKSMIIHLDIERKEQSLVERYHLWDRALQVIAARPLTGTGINTYALSHAKYDKRQNWRVKNYYAHNGYLQLAAETGLPSLFCLLAFVGLILLDAWGRIRRQSPQAAGKAAGLALMTGAAGFLFFMAVDTVFHNPQSVMMFWFLLGLLPVYARQEAPVNTPHDIPPK